jgi:hypothetical protein
MTGHTEKKCPHCGQMLRVPTDKGGITMVCPSCGNKIHSDFKFGGVRQKTSKNIFITIFEMPYKILSSIIQFFYTRS